MKAQNKIALLFTCLFIFVFVNNVTAKQYVMKIASAGPMSSATLSAPTFFKSAIERQSSGQIKVNIYDSGQMGSEHDVFMKTKMGALQAGMTSVFETSRHASPHMLVSMLPFVWTHDNFDKFRKSKAYKPFFNSLDKEGLKMLGITNVGYYGFITCKPIRTLKDLKEAGKIRVTEAPIARKIMNSLGVTPTVMAWGEVYQSLQRGVISGVNHAAEFLVSAKLHEPCNYFTNLKYMYPQSCFYVNQKWLNKLPKNLRKLVKVNAKSACSAARELAVLKRNMALNTMEEAGIEIITPSKEELEKFKKAAHKVHEEYEKKIGKEYLQKIYDITNYNVQ